MALYDVIVVGGGPGGYTAALYAARAGLSTLVVEMLSPGGQMATTENVENYPGFEDGVDGFELGEKMQRGAEKAGAVTAYEEVKELDLAASPKLVRTRKHEYRAKAVILAMGASPRMLGLPQEEDLRGKGVAYCATCDGMQYKGKVVAVAGGGNSAAEDALTLSKICQKVYIVHRRDTLRAERSYLAPLEKAGNVEYVWDSRIEELLHDGRLTGLRLANVKTGQESTLTVDGLFVAIVRKPETALVEGQVEMGPGGYIAAGEDTRTNVPGVFAVGDIRTKPLRQIVTAAADGAVASKMAQEYVAGLA